MALYPWRLQGEIGKGETDPMVTVFMGAERAVMDDNGEPTAERFIQQDTKNPAVMKLSEVAAALADPTLLQAARPPKPAF
jgi:hypothetical protein